VYRCLTDHIEANGKKGAGRAILSGALPQQRQILFVLIDEHTSPCVPLVLRNCGCSRWKQPRGWSQRDRRLFQFKKEITKKRPRDLLASKNCRRSASSRSSVIAPPLDDETSAISLQFTAPGSPEGRPANTAGRRAHPHRFDCPPHHTIVRPGEIPIHQNLSLRRGLRWTDNFSSITIRKI
jgi:hypothetical protein